MYFLAKQFPDTPIVLDHLGTPVGIFGTVGKKTGRTEKERLQIFEHWQSALAQLAECPNVSTKISGLFMPVLGHRFHRTRTLATKDELMSLAYPLIQHAYECFGKDRLMFASNFPMDSVSTTLEVIIDGFSDIIQQLDESALKSIFYDNAKHFYKI